MLPDWLGTLNKSRKDSNPNETFQEKKKKTGDANSFKPGFNSLFFHVFDLALQYKHLKAH